MPTSVMLSGLSEELNADYVAGTVQASGEVGFRIDRKGIKHWGCAHDRRPSRFRQLRPSQWDGIDRRRHTGLAARLR